MTTVEMIPCDLCIRQRIRGLSVVDARAAVGVVKLVTPDGKLLVRALTCLECARLAPPLIAGGELVPAAYHVELAQWPDVGRPVPAAEEVTD